MKRLLKELLLVSLILFAGCEKEPKSDDYIAKVENTYLLKQELVGMDSNFVRNYVEIWIRNNLLYEEALSRGYEPDEKIERMVEEFRRSLVVKKFLQNEIMKEAEKITDEEIKEFYERHQDEFILDRPIVKIGYIKLKSRGDAIALRSKLIPPKNFQKIIDGLSTEPGVVEIVKERYYDQFNIPSSDLWRVAWNLNRGETSFPIRSGENYFLIYLYDKKEAGNKADFEFVADVVKERAIVEKQNLMLDSLISNLKRKYNYEVKW